MNGDYKPRGAAWWRGYWEQALTGGDTVVNIRSLDAALHDMIAELEHAERRATVVGPKS